MSAIETNVASDIARQDRDAYDATAADRAALQPSELLAINLDVPLAVSTVIGAMRTSQSLREEVKATFVSARFLELFDKAEAYARAFRHANMRHRLTTGPEEVLPTLATRGIELREALLADAKVLSRRGHVPAKPLTELKGGPGYLQIAADLTALSEMFRERWSTIASKTSLPEADLDEAATIAARINDAHSDRSRPNERISATADDRQRAFTLFVKTYEQVRRITMFLRYDMDDAEKFAPSLWSGRGRGSSSEAPSKVDPNAVTEPGPVPLPSIPQAPAPVVPAGMPGGSPFTDN